MPLPYLYNRLALSKIFQMNGKEDVACRYTQTHAHTHTMEYYSAIKKNENWPSATVWMDLEGIMFSEISQMKKHKYCMFSLHVESEK